MKKKWAIEDSKKLYRIEQWGKGYFSINKQGNVIVLPDQTPDGPSIDIQDVIEEIKDQGIQFPVLVRFHDLIRSQVIAINEAFRSVIKEAHYKGHYMGVYPIKVNQMREVIEEIIDAGKPYNLGLECGSTTEMLSVLAYNRSQKNLTILNGFKDKRYLRLAFLGYKLGRKIIIVIEKFSELIETIRLSEEAGIDPIIGFRVKLAAKGSGLWVESGGDRAKFGLSITEVLQALDYLAAHDKTHCLKLIHFHIGSQITNIASIKDAMTEGAQIYCKLFKRGIPLEFLDVGGGLGIDYDGSKSQDNSSINYTERDYAEDIVYILQQTCDAEGVPHPTIVSESGRFLTARHACVITKVFDKSEPCIPDTIPVLTKEHMIVRNLRTCWNDLTDQNYQESFHDVIQLKKQAEEAFKLGILSLEERSIVETLYWKFVQKINEFIVDCEEVPELFQNIGESLAPQYICNCSFFQSVPDHWAIGQLFPIMPLRRLNEKPTVQCTLADITCDSDGTIEEFIKLNQPQSTLPVHELTQDEEYYIGMFFTGAYQDVIGDMHNMFGCLNEVHIYCDDEDPTDFYIEEVVKGDTCHDVLANMQYNTGYMAATIKRAISTQIQKGTLQPKEGVKLVDYYEKCLHDYTYLSLETT